MPPSPTVPRAYWPHPMGPPTLAAEALRKAQADTLATRRLRYDPFSRLMFLTVDVLYGRRRSLEKFLVLEQHSAIAADYGRFASLGDLLRQIGHDERVHKLESLAGHDTARRDQTRTGLDSSARRAA